MTKLLTFVAIGLFALGLAAPVMAECAGKPHTASAPQTTVSVETASTQTPAPATNQGR